MEKVYQPITDKVFTQEETKLFDVKGVVAYSAKESAYSYSNPVPVIDSQRTRIGFASLRFNKGVLTAEASIDYASEARLLIQVGERVYYSLRGHYDDADCFNVEGLELTTDKPFDSRIEPVGTILL